MIITPLFIRQTSSPAETEFVGGELAKLIADGSVPPYVALYGDLGVGKTALTRGIAALLAPGAAVRSPTFALVNEYRNGPRPLYHFDMYRINDEDDLFSIGYYDYLDGNGICVVEWSEKIPYALPRRYLRVTMAKCAQDNPDARHIAAELIEEAQAPGKDGLC